MPASYDDVSSRYNLPDSILLKIANRCDRGSLNALTRACKRFHSLFNHVLASRYYLPDSVLLKIAYRCDPGPLNALTRTCKRFHSLFNHVLYGRGAKAAFWWAVCEGRHGTVVRASGTAPMFHLGPTWIEPLQMYDTVKGRLPPDLSSSFDRVWFRNEEDRLSGHFNNVWLDDRDISLAIRVATHEGHTTIVEYLSRYLARAAAEGDTLSRVMGASLLDMLKEMSKEMSKKMSKEVVSNFPNYQLLLENSASESQCPVNKQYQSVEDEQHLTAQECQSQFLRALLASEPIGDIQLVREIMNGIPRHP